MINMSVRHRLMCGCECHISAKNIHLSLLTLRDHYLKKLKYQGQNSHNRRSGEMKSLIFKPIRIM